MTRGIVLFVGIRGSRIAILNYISENARMRFFELVLLQSKECFDVAGSFVPKPQIGFYRVDFNLFHDFLPNDLKCQKKTKTN